MCLHLHLMFTYKDHQQHAWHSLQVWDWTIPKPKSLACKAEENVERRERCSDVDWLCVIFIPWIICLHVDAGILLSTLSLGALIPTFPCPSLKVHHWIKFPVQIATELLPFSKVLLFCLISHHLSTFLLQNLLGRLSEAQVADTNSFADALNSHRSFLLLLTWFESLLLSGGKLLWFPPPLLQALSKASFHSDLAYSSSSSHLAQSWVAVRIYCNLIVSWDIRCCINYSDPEIVKYKT